MATKNNRLVPAKAIHPGEILREELLERGIKQKDFAQQIGVQATHLNEFIKGKRNLNEDLAMKLEQHLGISYSTWMSLHNGYVYDCKAIESKRTKVKVLISQTEDGKYQCTSEKPVYGATLAASGDTVKEAKEEFAKRLVCAKEECRSKGEAVKEIEPEYKYDLQAFFSYFSFFNVSELAKRSHISPALMLQYSNGTKKAGEKTYARLSACVGDISRELQAVSFL